MTTTINAGGGDWLDLPTTPIPHRGPRKAEGLPWDQINADYVARGGQVDADVWPKVGKVRLIGNRGGSRKDLHTWEEAQADEDYGNPLSQGKPKRVKPKLGLKSTPPNTKITPEQRVIVGRRYQDGESLPELAKDYGVSVTTIRNTLDAVGIPVRSRLEAGVIRRARRTS